METRVVTVARQVGTNGEEVARVVASSLGFRLLDYRLVQEAAQEAGVSPETISEAEHKPSFFGRIIEALARNPAGPASGQWGEPINIAATPLLTSADYRQLVEQVVQNFAEGGNVVFLGHGAQFMLRDRADTFRVLVVGSEDVRARRLMASMNVDESKAREVVQKTDKERIDYFRTYYDVGWTSPTSYDLTVNTDHLNPQQAADLILGAIKVRDVAPMAV